MNRKTTTHGKRSKNKKNAVRRRRRRGITKCPPKYGLRVSSHPTWCHSTIDSCVHFFLSRASNVFTCPWHLHLFPSIQRGSLCFERKPNSLRGGHIVYYCFPHGTKLELDVSSAQKKMDGSEAEREGNDFQFEKSRPTERKSDPSFARDHLLRLRSMWHTGQFNERRAQHKYTQHTWGRNPNKCGTLYIPLRRALRGRVRTVWLHACHVTKVLPLWNQNKNTRNRKKKKEREREFHTRMAAPLHGRSIKRRRSKHPKGPGAEDENGGATTTTKLREAKKTRKSQEERKREREEKGRIIERTFPRGTVWPHWVFHRNGVI